MYAMIAAVLFTAALAVSAHAAAVLQPRAAGPRTFVSRKNSDMRIRSHVGFRLAVQGTSWSAERHVLRRPGTHRVRLRGDDSSQLLTVRIESVRREDVLQGEQGFCLRFAGWKDRGLRTFYTQEGVTCRLSTDPARPLWLLRSADPGRELFVSGDKTSGSVLTVRSLLFAPSKAFPRRPRVWRVELDPAGGPPVRLWKTGTYRTALSGSALEVNLREVKRCRLSVGGHPVNTWVADGPGARSRGLQPWEKLTDDEGMLFILERAARPEFLMKSVSFPLSIAFFRRSGRLVHLERRDPGDQRPAEPPRRVSYVLEMNRGWFRERGLHTGCRMEFPGPDEEGAPRDEK